MNTETSPVVSIAVTTFNMEAFIAKGLDSWLIQKTSFPIEIVISDDGSEDKTRDIVQNYMMVHSNIRLICTGHIGKMPNFIRSMQACRGKYVALCEGDDYWTDSLKLQKQVDFMEGHPDYSMCFHAVRIDSPYEEEGNLLAKLESRDYSAKEIYENWTVPTCSVVFRRCFIGYLFEHRKRIIFGDIYLFLKLSQKGKLYCNNYVGGVYRRHSGGVSVSLTQSATQRLIEQYHWMRRLFTDPALRKISKRNESDHLMGMIYDLSSPKILKNRLWYMELHPHLFISRFMIDTVKLIFSRQP